MRVPYPPLRVNSYKGRCPIKNHSRPFLWKGQTSEARRGWLPNEGVPFHAANLRPFGAPPSKGRREKKGAACIVIGLFAAKPTPSLLYPLPLNPPLPFLFQRKAERCAAHVGKARVPECEGSGLSWRLCRDRWLRSQLFWHSLSHIRRFSPLRMTKRGDVRRMDDRSQMSDI